MELALPSQRTNTSRDFRTFGNFVLHRQVGRGGMGLIYEATKNGELPAVALKVLREDVSASPIVLRRFLQEAEGAASMDHPNIVPIYDIGEFEGQCYFSMKLIEGSSLDHLITNIGYRPEGASHQRPDRAVQESIATLVAAIARAVDYAHSRKIVHRDLKPANILLDRAGKPYLTDFGLAKFLEASGGMTLSNHPIGTPAYMSPEQARGRHTEITGATDIFSLGIILYEMLTGRTPFHGVTPVETILNVTTTPPEDPRRLNKELGRDLSIICLKCLEKDPSRRYSTAAELADDLERWLRREPIKGRPPGPVRQIKNWAEHHPVMATVTLCLALVTGILVVALHIVSVQRQIAITEAQNAKEESVQKERLLRKSRERWLSDLKQFAKETDPYIEIPSGAIADWIGVPPTSLPPGATPTNLYFGVYNWDKPANMLDRFSRILHQLETTVEGPLGQPVLVNLRIYRTYAMGQQALIDGDIHFARLGPASYVKARRSNPHIRLILAENRSGRCCIFVAASSPIRSLQDLKGKRLALGDRDSTSGARFPKFRMWKEGITADQFTHIGYLGEHSEVIRQVAEGSYDAGAANESEVDRFERNNRVKLRRLLEIDVGVGKPWVAQPGLSDRLLTSLRAGLQLITDYNALIPLGNDISGFLRVQNSDFDAVAEATDNSGRFDGESAPDNNPDE